MSDDLPHFDGVAEQLHGDLLLKPLTDSDNTGFSNHIEKGASVDEVTKTTSKKVFLQARCASAADGVIHRQLRGQMG